MQHYTITKIFILLIILKNLIIFVYFVKCKNFYQLVEYIKKEQLRSIKSIEVSAERIFRYERLLSKILKIDKCLISACCINKTMKSFGLASNIFFGISIDGEFKSHSWIEYKEKKFLYSPDFKTIYKL